MGEAQIYFESIIYLEGRTYVIIVGTKWVDPSVQEDPVGEDSDSSPLADISLLSIVEKHRALEGLPVDFVFQGGFISLVRANREMGKDAVREDLTDVVLQSSSILHPILEQLRITWEARQCDRPDRCEFGSLAFPRIDRSISVDELDTILTLLNPISEKLNFRGERIGIDNGVARAIIQEEDVRK